MIKRVPLIDDDREWQVTIGDADVRVEGDDRAFVFVPRDDGRIDAAIDGQTVVASAVVDDETVWVDVGHDVYEFKVPPPGGSAGAHAADLLTPPMPATVVRVLVKAGDTVKAGDVLVALEAMKMELPIRAPHDGTVEAVECREGDLVQPGQVLVRL